MFKKLGLLGLAMGAALTLLPATAAAQDWHDHDGGYGYYHRDGDRGWDRHERREREEREWRRREHQEREWREQQWREQRRNGYLNYNQYAPTYYGDPYNPRNPY